jgi:hypothetical protein
MKKFIIILSTILILYCILLLILDFTSNYVDMDNVIYHIVLIIWNMINLLVAIFLIKEDF